MNVTDYQGSTDRHGRVIAGTSGSFQPAKRYGTQSNDQQYNHEAFGRDTGDLSNDKGHNLPPVPRSILRVHPSDPNGRLNST